MCFLLNREKTVQYCSCVAGKKVGRDSDDDVFGDGCEYGAGRNDRRDHKIPFVRFHASHKKL